MTDDEHLAEVIAFPGFGRATSESASDEREAAGRKDAPVEPDSSTGHRPAASRIGWGGRPVDPSAEYAGATDPSPSAEALGPADDLGTADERGTAGERGTGNERGSADATAPADATGPAADPAPAAEPARAPVGWGAPRSARRAAPPAADPREEPPSRGSAPEPAALANPLLAGDPAAKVDRLREQIRRIEASGADDATGRTAGRASDAGAPTAGDESRLHAPEPQRSAAPAPLSESRIARVRPRVTFVASDALDSDPDRSGRADGASPSDPRRAGAGRPRRAAIDPDSAPSEHRERPAASGPRRPARPANVAVLPGTAGDAGVIDEASDALVRWLGRAPRSVRDARHFLRDGFEELGALDLDRIVDRMIELRYLDDTALAEQLRDGRLRRRNLGRAAMARELRDLGIDDTVIDEVLGELDRDAEYEQALELARSRVRRVAVGDRDTAFRRLHADLSRRGYGGELASRAVRQALDEQ